MVESDWGLLNIKRAVLDYSQALKFICKYLTGLIEMSV